MLRLASGALILIAAVLVYMATQKADAAALGACGTPEEHPTQAVEVCTHLLASSKLTGRQRGGLYRLRGQAYLKLDDWRAAISDFDQAVALRPDDYVVWNGRALGYLKLGENEKSLADLRVSYELNPANTFSISRIFIVLQKLDRHEEAEAFFREKAALYPNEHWISFHLGKMLFEQERYGDAAEAYETVLQGDISHGRARQGFLDACRHLQDACPPLNLGGATSPQPVSCAHADRKLRAGFEAFSALLSELENAHFQELMTEENDLLFFAEGLLQTALKDLEQYGSVESSKQLLIHHRFAECVAKQSNKNLEITQLAFEEDDRRFPIMVRENALRIAIQVLADKTASP